MRHHSRLVVLCAAAAAFVLPALVGCDWSSQGDPMPNDYPYHTHPAVLRIQAANWDLEPVGVETVAMFCAGGTAGRPGWGFSVPYDSSVDFTLRRGDTSTTTCTTSVIHFSGYQRKHHGDTTRLGVLDGDTGWVCRLFLAGGHVSVPDGKSVIVRPEALCEVGDTLFPGVPWMLEVELDMSGLFSRDTGDIYDELVMHAEYTHGRQVRQ